MRRMGMFLTLLAAFAVTSAGRWDREPPNSNRPVPNAVFFAADARTATERNAWLEARIRAGELKLLRVETSLGGLRHERFQQYYQTYPVFGAQVIRHWKDRRLAWMGGQFFESIRLPSPLPSVPESRAVEAVERSLRTDGERLARGEIRLGVPGRGTVTVPIGPRVALVVLPWPLDEPREFHLAYQVDVATDRLWAYRYFVSAATGAVIGRLDRAYTQATIALGQGQWYTMKMPVFYESGAYFLADAFRPGVSPIPELSGIAVLTFNDRNECCPDDRCLSDDHVGRNSSDRWPDPVEADAHARAGWVDDFYFRVFQRNGWAGDWLPSVQVVHFCRNYLNAFFTEAGFPNFGLMVYGDGVPSYTYPFTAGFDVIAHEFTHGTTAKTSDLVYFRESGALNEAFSDIMAVTAEFAFEPEGNGYGQADWLIGEDLFKAPWPFCPSARTLRSMADPENGGCGYQPSHYVNRYLGSADNGGVHINSGIINHAFYLLAVGGRHRLSGISVPGIGRDRAARVFYVGFTQCLWPTAVFRDARYCVAQAAQNLYGSDAASAVHSAFDAVGVPR